MPYKYRSYYRGAGFPKGKNKRFRFVIPKASILSFIFALTFAGLYTIDYSESDRHLNSRYSDSHKHAYSTYSIAADSSFYTALISTSDRGILDNFLAAQDESACSAVYDESIVQKVISHIPQIAGKIQSLSKAQQYQTCITKIRSAKSLSNKPL